MEAVCSARHFKLIEEVMQPRFNRRSAPKVRDGKVQWKSRHAVTTHPGYVIERRPAGKGFTHVVSKRNVQDFIGLIPDWEKYSERLDRIILASGNTYEGLHEYIRREAVGTISLCAWEKQTWMPIAPRYFADHRGIFEAIGVPFEMRLTKVMCRFTIAQARAYMLLHVFVHELGHHYDWLCKRSYSRDAEEIAESFAHRHFDSLLPKYIERFGDPRKENGT